MEAENSVDDLTAGMSEQPALLRRAPRLGRFLGTGIFLGVVIGVIAALLMPPGGPYARSATIILLAGAGALVGGLWSGLHVVIADKVATRRVESVRMFSTTPIATDTDVTDPASPDVPSGTQKDTE